MLLKVLSLLLLFVNNEYASVQRVKYDNFILLNLDQSEVGIPSSWIRKQADDQAVIDLSSDTGNQVSLAVSPKMRQQLLGQLETRKIKYKVVSENLQALIDVERGEGGEKVFKRSIEEEDFDYFNYHNLDEINSQLVQLSKKYSHKVQLSSIGTTYENRTVNLVQIGLNASRNIFMECGIHAREWISPATCLWIVNQLITNSSLESLIQSYSFHIIPVMNADGYTYTWDVNRLWRKNRRPIQSSHCYGVDLNRNFDFYFGRHSSADPCDTTYSGPFAFSEKESQMYRDYIKQISAGGQLVMTFSVHSYGQLLMYSPGESEYKVDNRKQLDQFSKIGQRAIYETNQMIYRVGPIYSTIYPASGSTIDWIHSSNSSKLAYAVELRDKSTFILPRSQIKPTSEEFWNGIQAMIKAL